MAAHVTPLGNVRYCLIAPIFRAVAVSVRRSSENVGGHRGPLYLSSPRPPLHRSDGILAMMGAQPATVLITHPPERCASSYGHRPPSVGAHGRAPLPAARQYLDEQRSRSRSG